jgi:hypothetical protein
MTTTVEPPPLEAPPAKTPNTVPGVRMIWRAANGHILETFDRL